MQILIWALVNPLRGLIYNSILTASKIEIIPGYKYRNVKCKEMLSESVQLEYKAHKSQHLLSAHNAI